MPDYYVNRDTTYNPNHNHEVHKPGCIFFPSNREYLGNYTNAIPAVAEAKRRGYADADGCKTCSLEAHHG